MNPLFLAHLVADFLLQPTALVQLKMRKILGVIIHAAIHALTMAILMTPHTAKTIIMIAAIALAHGVIDYTKIRVTKHQTSFEPGFLLDQGAHGAILFAASLGYTVPVFWHSQTGIIIALITMVMTFALALWNLKNIPSAPLTTFKAWSLRFGAVAVTFVGFGAAGLLMR